MAVHRSRKGGCPPPPPQTRGKTRKLIYRWENVVRPFLVHNFLGPRPPPPPPSTTRFPRESVSANNSTSAIQWGGGGGDLVRGQVRGENFVFQLVSKVSPRKFSRNLGLFPLLVHPPCPSTLRDDEPAGLYCLAIRLGGGGGGNG